MSLERVRSNLLKNAQLAGRVVDSAPANTDTNEEDDIDSDLEETTQQPQIDQLLQATTFDTPTDASEV